MRLLWCFIVLAVLTLGVWMVWGEEFDNHFTLQGSIAWLQGSGQWAWAAGLLLLVSDLALPIPGTVVISALGYIYGVLVGGAIASVGLTLAGFVGYGVGRLCGEGFAKKWLGEKDYERGQRLFSNGGGWVVALSRTLPILPEVISCMAGLVRMPFGRFAAALACGSIPMGFVFAAIGKTGQDAPAVAIVLSIFIPGALWLVAKRCFR